MGVKEINEQILYLKKERQKVLDTEYAHLKDEFLKLDWLRDVSFYFDNQGYCGAGMHQYYLRGSHPLAKKVVVDLESHIELVKGEHYYDGIVIQKVGYIGEFGDFEIATNNPDLLSKFINDHNLKIASSDKKTYYSLAYLYTTLYNHGVC